MPHFEIQQLIDKQLPLLFSEALNIQPGFVELGNLTTALLADATQKPFPKGRVREEFVLYKITRRRRDIRGRQFWNQLGNIHRLLIPDHIR